MIIHIQTTFTIAFYRGYVSTLLRQRKNKHHNTGLQKIKATNHSCTAKYPLFKILNKPIDAIHQPLITIMYNYNTYC